MSSCRRKVRVRRAAALFSLGERIEDLPLRLRKRIKMTAVDRATLWVSVAIKGNMLCQCARIPENLTQGFPDQGQQAIDQQWKGIHRPIFCLLRASACWQR